MDTGQRNSARPTADHDSVGPVIDRAPDKDPIITEYRPENSNPTPNSRISARACSRATLPRPEWTHEAHLGATTWLLTRRPDVDVDQARPASSAATMRASAV